MCRRNGRTGRTRKRDGLACHAKVKRRRISAFQKLPKGTPKGVLFAVKIAANEAEKIQVAVRKSGLKKSDWARNALLAAAA